MRTVLMVPPSLEFYALTFALFKLGAVVVLIDPGMGVAKLLEGPFSVLSQGSWTVWTLLDATITVLTMAPPLVIVTVAGFGVVFEMATAKWKMELSTRLAPSFTRASV